MAFKYTYKGTPFHPFRIVNEEGLAYGMIQIRTSIGMKSRMLKVNFRLYCITVCSRISLISYFPVIKSILASKPMADISSITVLRLINFGII